MLSIVVVQYEPDRAALERTLLSILTQDDQDFELIIADDGSRNKRFDSTRALLNKYGREAQLLTLPENRGTVWNLWNGVSHAGGTWVYAISPGDYLYDAGTVRWIKACCRRDDVWAAFGKAAYYTQEPQLRQLPGQTPFDRSCYSAEHYRPQTIKRNMLLYDDGISGACAFYRTSLLRQALEEMKGRVRYAEDFSLRMFSVEKIHIHCYDRVICWYEDNTGVSSSQARMLKDWKAMLRLLREKFPRDRMVCLANLYFFNDERRSKILRGLIGHTIVPQWLPFKRKQKAYQPPVNGRIEELERIYHLQEEEQ